MFARLLLAALLLLGQGCEIRPPKPVKKAVYLVCYDNTMSVPRWQYFTYPEMVRKTLLTRLRPHDKVVLLILDSLTVQTWVMDGRLSHLEQNARAIYDRLTEIERSQNRRGITDFNLVFKHVARQIELDGGVDSPYRYILICTTDGIQDVPKGKETAVRPAPAGVDWKTIFVGPRSDVEDNLVRLAGKAGLPGDRVRVVPYDHFEAVSLDDFLMVPANPRLKKSLAETSIQ